VRSTCGPSKACARLRPRARLRAPHSGASGGFSPACAKAPARPPRQCRILALRPLRQHTPGPNFIAPFPPDRSLWQFWQAVTRALQADLSWGCFGKRDFRPSCIRRYVRSFGAKSRNFLHRKIIDSLEAGTGVSGVLGNSYARVTACQNCVFFPPGNIPRRGRLFNRMMFSSCRPFIATLFFLRPQVIEI
jgi:hypothetical protein